MYILRSITVSTYFFSSSRTPCSIRELSLQEVATAEKPPGCFTLMSFVCSFHIPDSILHPFLEMHYSFHIFFYFLLSSQIMERKKCRKVKSELRELCGKTSERCLTTYPSSSCDQARCEEAMVISWTRQSQASRSTHSQIPGPR